MQPAALAERDADDGRSQPTMDFFRSRRVCHVRGPGFAESSAAVIMMSAPDSRRGILSRRISEASSEFANGVLRMVSACVWD
jgi:hypothetical protein